MSSKGDVGVADTLPPDGGAAIAAPAGPPVTGWSRYELLELLGRGGMGVVYKARDRRLGRIVAIKFIHGADPNLTMRLGREAKVLAGLDHPNLCRVYEVDHVEGKPYLALQFVDGEPLDKAAAHMSPAEKIAVMRDVAMAVDEVHGQDIVHRDLKPANVLVERTKDGRWLPIVMDFGLARDATDIALTQSGVPLGTPAYMSPEQARGDVRAIDHRSDVYSLGATLYELLTGSVPFPATSTAAILMHVLDDDPIPLRKLAPDLPLDLEIIVMKCLAKDPEQRYASARALGADLGRYLDGESILGRRLPLWRRARQRARRHRALVGLGTASLAVILVVAALWLRASIHAGAERELAAQRAAEQAELTERLSREAARIERDLREAYLWPLHDVRRDRDRNRARMRAMAATPHTLGALGNAIVHNALGRGHLALHEWQDAANEFAAAADAGLATSELHAARGWALGELYRRALDKARRSIDQSSNPTWLATEERELERRYLTPALRELAQSRALGQATLSDEEARLLEARIALYRRDFAAAEQKASVVASDSVGSSEARKLAGDADYGAATTAFDRGEYDAARSRFSRAAARYVEASTISRSDASTYQAAAAAWLQIAEIESRRAGAPAAPMKRALDLLENGALVADPSDAISHVRLSQVLVRWDRTPGLVLDKDEPALLARIEQAAQHAVDSDRSEVQAWTALGHAHVFRCIYEIHHEGSGAESCNRAKIDFAAALAIEPGDPWANNGLGNAHRWGATILYRTGRDPTGAYEDAGRNYAVATRIAPQNLSACINRLDIHALLAEYQAAVGLDPQDSVSKARDVGTQCLRIDKNYYLVYEHLARTELVWARYLASRGDLDGMQDALGRASSRLDDYEATNPGSWPAKYYRLVVAVIQAASRLHRRENPARFVADGRALMTDARLTSSAGAMVESARLSLVEAEWTAATGVSSDSFVRNALRDAEAAVGLDHWLADARLVAADACFAIATTRRSREFAKRGLDHVEKALELNPQLAGAKQLRPKLQQLAR